MIQEKDFLYRVPVKTAPITTPGGQIRNPEILVDLEGGEFMHGNILDANSTSKLVNQSVKEAVDNKLIESGYVTKDLLDAETTRATEQENNLKTLIGAETGARTKGDEDLSSKIKAEQTRAEGKEKEISDKLAIVNGDSNTEGSFRKAIADVVAAAPEDLDTLKEIADKLAGNDDLHTALNQAITEKADASALANEVSRATGVESGLQAAIATKADATELSKYVLTTALNKKVDTLNTAISAKQDAGNYIPYKTIFNNFYNLNSLGIGFDCDKVVHTSIIGGRIEVQDYQKSRVQIGGGYMYLSKDPDGTIIEFDGSSGEINIYNEASTGSGLALTISKRGIFMPDSDNNHVLTASDSTIDITQYAKKTDIPQVDTSDFVSKTATDTQIIKSELNVKNKLRVAYNNANGSYTDISDHGIAIIGDGDTIITASNTEGIEVSDRSNPDDRYSAMNKDFISVRDSWAELRIGSNNITSYKLSESDPTGLGDANFQLRSNGVRLYGGDNNHVLTSGGSTIDITEYVLKSVYDEKIAALEARIAALEAKHTETTA